MSIASGPIASGPIAGDDSGSGLPVGPVILAVMAVDTWRLMAPIQVEAVDSWLILPFDPVSVLAEDRWLIGGPLPATILVATDYPTILTRESDGREFECTDISISIDEGSWQWTMTDASIASCADWSVIHVGDVMSVDVIGTEFRFEVDGHQQQRAPGSESFSITGRTPASGLDEGTTDVSLDGLTASAAVSAICTALGVAASWETVDWHLPVTATDTQQTPIELVQAIAAAVGAVAELSPTGSTLTVRPTYPISPTQYGVSAVSKTVSVESIFSIDDAFEARSGYDSVEIVDASQAKAPTYQWEVEKDGTHRIVSLSVVPWQAAVDLLDSGEGNLIASYLGSISYEISEEIEIIDGQGRVSKPFHGLTSVDWKYRSLGTLAINEDGSIQAATPSNTLASIRYTSRRHRWRCNAGVPRIQVYLDEQSQLSPGRIIVARAPGTNQAPAISDSWLSGVPAMLERGRNELDGQGLDRRNISIELPLSEYPVALSDLVEVSESDREGSWRGKVTSIALRVSVGTIPSMSLSLERPA